MTENFMYTMKELHRMDCDRKLLERERETERERYRQTGRQTDWVFLLTAIAVAGHLMPTLYNH